jgi:hypothetical protein
MMRYLVKGVGYTIRPRTGKVARVSLGTFETSAESRSEASNLAKTVLEEAFGFARVSVKVSKKGPGRPGKGGYS